MRGLFLHTAILLSCIACLAQNKDTSLSWLDPIDIKLLQTSCPGVQVSGLKANTDYSARWKAEASKYENEISSSQSRISAADSRMLSSYGKNSNDYHQAQMDRENAEWDKNMAENRAREAQFNASIVESSVKMIREMAAAKVAGKLEILKKAKNAYMMGQWDVCIENYEELLLGTEINAGAMYGISTDIGLTGSDFLLTARACERAAAKNLVPKAKRNLYEIWFICSGEGLNSMQAATLDHFEKRLFTQELMTWAIKNATKIPDKTREKYKDWFLNAWLVNLSEFSESAKLADISEYANSITKLVFTFGQATFYDDVVYPLTHVNDARNTIERTFKTPRLKENGSGEGSSLASLQFTDLNFVLAAYCKEQAGNKAEALEVWLNYLDYANFDWKHRSSALYLSLATRKAEELKKELGSSALPHTNQNWAITNRDFENVKEEKAKDEKRKAAGLDWDNEK